MIEAGILDGDTVIIKKTDTAANGDIVVALVDDEEATLKRFRRKGQSIALEAANPAYKTRIFGPDGIRIQGKLVGSDPPLLSDSASSLSGPPFSVLGLCRGSCRARRRGIRFAARRIDRSRDGCRRSAATVRTSTVLPRNAQRMSALFPQIAQSMTISGL